MPTTAVPHKAFSSVRTPIAASWSCHNPMGGTIAHPVFLNHKLSAWHAHAHGYFSMMLCLFMMYSCCLTVHSWLSCSAISSIC